MTKIKPPLCLKQFIFPLLASLLLLSTQTVARHTSLHPFIQGSYNNVKIELSGKPFLMVLWSIDCPPCHKELNMLGKLTKERPDLNLILISTDDIGLSDDIASTLKKHGLGEIESWAFADPNVARLRYEIDPKWYGTLPRSYFFDSTHQRSATTGSLEKEPVVAWLEQQK
jgi:thiol-disulfide isomerase/thioredoxin